MKKRTNQILGTLLCLATLLTACEKAPVNGGEETKPDEGGEVTPPDPTPEPADELVMVDLGLSVKWASQNLGAANPHKTGDRYAWGETAAKTSFAWSNYSFGETPSKYNATDQKTILDPEDDAAAKELKDFWRIPTKAEWDELRSASKCTWTWTERKGVAGYEVKSKSTENSIFLPAADLSYWTATLTSTPQMAYVLSMDANKYNTMLSGRNVGQLIRPVYGPAFHIVTPAASISYKAQTLEVEVVSSIGYHATSFPDWISETSVKEVGTGRKVHTFSIQANTTGAARTAVISFCNDEQKCVPYTVSQKPDEGVDWDKTFYHKSLMMRFTATWCQYCPMMATALKTAQANYPNKIIPANIHGGSSSLEFTNYTTLATLYDIDGYPSGIVDGRKSIGNSSNTDATANSIVNAVKETESKYPVTAAIGLNSAFTGQKLEVNVDMFLRNAEKYKLTIFLTESKIIASQADANAGAYINDYQHDDVVRMCLTSLTGDEISVTSPMSIVKKQYSVTVPTNYKKENLQLVVYVQRAFGDQTVAASGDFGGYYVDNAVVVPVGQKLEPAYAE